jgi:hypothetical protein
LGQRPVIWRCDFALQAFAATAVVNSFSTEFRIGRHRVLSLIVHKRHNEKHA